jgi:gamma-glutamylcyclotransferase (GGCT)/AIG2-like uncharacterized protein YtfP
MSVKLLFSYGSLQRGRSNHRILSQFNPEYIGKGHVKGQLLNPIVLILRGNSMVPGELYKVPDEAWYTLDSFEANGIAYERTIVDVHMLDGSIVQAWVYEYIYDRDGNTRC